MNRASSDLKFGVPKPVTGSHPRAAGKPSVPHPGFVPFLISLNAVANRCEYSAGLIHPTGPLPAAMRASLTAATSDAKIGALAPP